MLKRDIKAKKYYRMFKCIDIGIIFEYRGYNFIKTGINKCKPFYTVNTKGNYPLDVEFILEKNVIVSYEIIL